jgi:small subunit ribosomal protein S20
MGLPDRQAATQERFTKQCLATVQPHAKGFDVANHPSSEKRNRQRIVRTERNRQRKSTVRTVVKQVRVAAEERQDIATVKKLLLNAIVELGKAGTKGVFHKKTVSRRIGRLNAMVHKLSKMAPAAAPTAKPAKATKTAKTAKPAAAKPAKKA